MVAVGAENVIRPSGEGRCIWRPIVSHRRTTVAHLVRPRVGSCVCAARTSPLIAKIELTHSIASIYSSCSQGRMRFSAPTGSVFLGREEIPAQFGGRYRMPTESLPSLPFQRTKAPCVHSISHHRRRTGTPPSQRVVMALAFRRRSRAASRQLSRHQAPPSLRRRPGLVRAGFGLGLLLRCQGGSGPIRVESEPATLGRQE